MFCCYPSGCTVVNTTIFLRTLAQSGRVLDLGSRSRRFEPFMSDFRLSGGIGIHGSLKNYFSNGSNLFSDIFMNMRPLAAITLIR